MVRCTRWMAIEHRRNLSNLPIFRKKFGSLTLPLFHLKPKNEESERVKLQLVKVCLENTWAPF